MTVEERLGRIDAKLEAIHDQAKRTNGSVADLFDKHHKTNQRINGLCNWRSFMTGGLSVLYALVVPVLLYMIYLWMRGHVL